MLWYDVVHAWRMMRRSPTTAAGIVLVIGLAVGATTAVGSLFNAVLLRPLPYRDPDGLVMLFRLFPQGTPGRATYADLLDWRRRGTLFQDLAAVRSEDYDLIVGDSPKRVVATVVTPSFFALLGVPPLMGRWFVDTDDEPGSPPVVLLTEGTWRSVFGADPHMVGRRVRLVSFWAEPADYEIVGVVPSDVRLYQLPAPALFVPQVRSMESDPGAVYQVFGRLKAGITPAQATAELSRLIFQGGPSSHVPSAGGQVVRLLDAEVGRTRQGLTMLTVASGLLMLMACVNLATLLLGLGARRSQELAVRAVTGATRARLVRQMLTEHLLLTCAGGALGLGVAVTGLRVVLALSPPDLPRLAELTIDRRILVLTFGMAVVTGVLSGLLPAMLTSKVDVRSVLAGSWGMGKGRRAQWRDVLVAVQLGLVVATVVAASLPVHSLWKLVRVKLGFDPGGVVAVELSLGRSYRGDQGARILAFQRQLLERARALPEATEAALTNLMPGSGGRRPLTLPSGELVWPVARDVTAEYFRVLRIPIVQGRTFGERDERQCLVVNELFARRFFSGAHVVGQEVPSSRTIIGVAGNTWEGHATLSAEPMCYTSFFDRAWAHFWLLVRIRSSEAALVTRIRTLVRDIDPQLPVVVTTLEQHLAGKRVQLRFYAVVLASFAVLGLLLAATGVFAVTHEAVRERTQEIGVRVALGATAGGICWLVLRRMALLSVAGVLGGGWLGISTARALRGVLFGLTEPERVTLAAAGLLLLAVVVAALAGPLRRAMTIDPLTALRQL